MIFSCLVHLVILELVWCIYVPDEIYPKKSVATPAHHYIQTKTQISNELTSDATKIANENYFPDVIYPTSILDVAQPFFYRENTQDLVLGPFSDDVKSSYKYITFKTGKSNIDNQILKNILQSQENLESGIENKGNTCSNESSKENENNDEILSELSNENINNIIGDTFMVNRHNISILSSTSNSQTNNYTDVDEDISCSHLKDDVKDTSDEVDNYLEDIEIPVKENLSEVYNIISDLKRQGSYEDKSVTVNLEFNLTKEINETSLEEKIKPLNLTKQSIFLDNHNLSSNKVIMMDLNEPLPPLPVGCFESRNVTSNILTKPTEKDIQLSSENSLDTTLKINLSNDNHTIGNSECCETDLYLEWLPVTLENETYSDYEYNYTNIDNDNTEAEDEHEEFFLDMIISLASICETDDIKKSLNKDNEKYLMEIPIIDQTNNIPLYNMNAIQEHTYKE